MLTKADDFPIHQTPEPIAFSGTDRNFDRYFFSASPRTDRFSSPSPSASIHNSASWMRPSQSSSKTSNMCCARRGALRAANAWMCSRSNLIDIVEPLYTLAVTIAPNDGPLSGRSDFRRAPPAFAELRFTRRIGARALWIIHA
ncbi:MAG: hypothetical protein M5R36_16260 [Deltaproteobacteria bacterium]|nr:hypothetical protein [Deltaproteobacteria bacterium]